MPLTPGPWEAYDTGDDEGLCVGDANDRNFIVICEQVVDADHARAIAAIPDAAAALRLAFDFVGKHSTGNPYLTEPGKTIAAVLAKIDGEG